ncbi:MAG: hypothetical protein ACRDHN_08145, partial [Thermomicrobiales bacterium]
KSVMIEMIKLNDLMVRVSSVHRKMPSNPQVFEIVLLIPGVSGYRDIDHILNHQRMTLTLFSDDGPAETHEVAIDRHDIVPVGPETAPRTRHFLVMRVVDPDADVDVEELSVAFDEVDAALARLKCLLGIAKETPG